MDEFFKYDPLTAGSKGLVFIGDKILVYRRDNKTGNHPNELDLPGGGPEENETPFETFQREVKEEFQLDLLPNDIVYVRKYPGTFEQGKFGYYPVAKLPKEVESNIKFGNEGVEFLLMSLDEYINRDDAWPVFQERAKDYLKAQFKA
ncbi:MAG: NUDIX domain-containing protein [Patescibacteria group bacterium]